MLLRGIAVAVSLIAGAALMLDMADGEAAVPGADRQGPKISMAPMSIGNTATTTVLASLNARRPVVTGSTPRGKVTPAPVSYQQPHRVKPGDTLARILKRAGATAQTAGAAIRTLKGIFDPRRLKIGQTITISFTATQRFNGFEIPLDYAHSIQVAPAPQGGFKAYKIERDLQTQPVRAEGSITGSLFAAGAAAGVPASVMSELVRVFSWDVDFQRDIRKGDRFEVMYERKINADGQVIHNGRITFAALTLSGMRKPIYLHHLNTGAWDYFDDQGQSAKKALMRTPIDGARLSSSFGRRKHPILGYTKMHKGTDFAAPRGTPIYAAGDGTIEKAGRNGSYGNYIRIRHNAEYSTAYAHMKSIKRGVARGVRVHQGQVIGFVGTTGRSTGPHLHYEVLRHGHQVNPMRVKMPSGQKLKGQELAQFTNARDQLDALWASLKKPAPQLAQR